MTKVVQYQSGMSNGYFLIDRGIVAVDCGSKLGTELFLEQCRVHDIDPEQIRLLVVTHGHIDHFINMGAMRAACGAPVLCHRHAARELRLGQYPKLYARSGLGERLLHGDMAPPPRKRRDYLPPVEPDLIFENEFDLSPYGISGRIIETPGHSRGCCSVVLEDGQAIVGDLLVEDFRGGAALAYFGMDEDKSVSNQAMFASCERLLSCGITTVYSGHGGPYTRQQLELALQEARKEAGE